MAAGKVRVPCYMLSRHALFFECFYACCLPHVRSASEPRHVLCVSCACQCGSTHQVLLTCFFLL
jgi:hypothetical protein